MAVSRLLYRQVTPAAQGMQGLRELSPLLFERKCLGRRRHDGRRSELRRPRRRSEIFWQLPNLLLISAVTEANERVVVFWRSRTEIRYELAGLPHMTEAVLCVPASPSACIG